MISFEYYGHASPGDPPPLSSPENGINENLSLKSLSVLSPLVLAANLFLLLGSEVVRDVERLADLLGRLALNHISDRLATDVEERFNVQVVRSLETWYIS